MTQLHVEHCQLTYEGAFGKPAFGLVDSPGTLCDLLLEALGRFGCTSADLTLEDGELGDRGVTCEVDELEARVTLLGDRMEIHCANAVSATSASVAEMLESAWSGLARLNTRVVAKTHSFQFDADVTNRGLSYQELLNHLARAPESLPGGTETAIVYYLPAEPGKGYGESSLVLSRSDGVERRLQVNATLVYEAESMRPAAAISAAKNRLSELMRNLGFEWSED